MLSNLVAAAQVASLFLAVTLVDMTQAGTTVALMDPGIAAASILASRTLGYMDGSSLAEVFAWLRPDDLIWNYWVNNYLQGKPPPRFDILYWNADTTRMPAALHRDFIEIAMANALAKPGTVSMLGSPVDLSRIDTDSYVAAGIADYIVPWPSAYRATQLLCGKIRFVLSNGDHVASQVNPPTNPKPSYRLAAANPPDHRDWLTKAETFQGSWWQNYTSWLADRSGGMKQCPRTLGSTKYPAVGSRTRYLRLSAVGDAGRYRGPLPGGEPPAASAASVCAASRASRHARGGARQAPEPRRSGSGWGGATGRHAQVPGEG